jgi:hypothetical protein
MQQSPIAPTQVAGRWPDPMARGISLCAVPAAGAGGGGTTDEFLPLALVLAALAGTAVWMFRRWGAEGGAEAPVPTADRPPVTAEV